MKKDNKFFAVFFVITIVVLILNFVARKHYNDTRIIDLSIKWYQESGHLKVLFGHYKV